MAIDIKHYNNKFIDHYNKTGHALNEASSYNITIDPAKVERDREYWACIGVVHLSGKENMGNHNIFCDVLDSSGDRVRQATLTMYQGHLSPVRAVIDKPDYEAGTNFPVWDATPCDVEVFSFGIPSDRVKGFRVNHPDEEGGGNTIGHHSFYVVWQLRVAKWDTIPVTPNPRPPEPEGSNGSKIVQTENLTFDIDKYQVDLLIVIKEK